MNLHLNCIIRILAMTTKATLYLTCVLCRDGGVVRYPEGYDRSGIEIVGDFTGRFLAATVCHSCFTDPKNDVAVEYFSEYGTDNNYVLSTLVSSEANYEYTGTVSIVSKDGFTAYILNIHFITRTVNKDCIVRSMKYSDNRMLEVPSEYGFFGPIITCRRNS